MAQDDTKSKAIGENLTQPTTQERPEISFELLPEHALLLMDKIF